MVATEKRKMRDATGRSAAGTGRIAAIVLTVCAVCAGGILAARADADRILLSHIAPSYANGLIVEASGQSTDDAIRVWRRAAWQEDDLMAQVHLGEIYSNQTKYRDYYDPVEAYVWYFMATRNDQHYYSDDSYVNQKINGFRYTARRARRAIFESLNLDQRMQARDRIIYILGSRGGEGYVSLAQLHQILPAPPPQKDVSCVYNPSWYRQFVNWIHSWFSDDPAERKPGDFDWVYSANIAEDAEVTDNDDLCRDRPMPSSAPPQQQKVRSSYQPEFSALVRSNEDALMYLFIAEKLSHPFAGTYIESLEYAISGNGKYNIDAMIERAQRRAGLFVLPFEYYLGATIGETPHSDERPFGYYEQEALGRWNEIPPGAAERALRFRGYLHTGRDRHPSPGDFERAVADFQKAARFEPTGRLTPEQLVRLIKTAALYGDASSQNRLGVMYAKGIGVPRNFPRAEFWFQTAANQLYGEALFNLSILYRKGVLGVPQNQDKAERYRDASAKAGYRPTRNEMLELLSKTGEDGRDKGNP